MTPAEVLEAAFPESECHANDTAEKLLTLSRKNYYARTGTEPQPTPPPRKVLAYTYMRLMLGGRTA